MDPTTYPTLRICGKEYELKFRQIDFIQLWKDLKIDLFRLDKLRFASPDYVERHLQIIRYGIRHQECLDFEALATSYTLDDVGAQETAIADAIKKAWSQIKTEMPEEMKAAEAATSQ